jgi:hypothetical protein
MSRQMSNLLSFHRFGFERDASRGFNDLPTPPLNTGSKCRWVGIDNLIDEISAASDAAGKCRPTLLANRGSI